VAMNPTLSEFTAKPHAGAALVAPQRLRFFRVAADDFHESTPSDLVGALTTIPSPVAALLAVSAGRSAALARSRAHRMSTPSASRVSSAGEW